MSEVESSRCIGWMDPNGEVFIPSDGSERSQQIMDKIAPSWRPVFEQETE